MLLVASISLAVQAFTAGHLGITLLRLLVAGLTAIAGLYLLVAPLEGTYTLRMMYVIWFVAIGFARLAGGLAHLGTPGAGATAFSGLLSVILGILIAEKEPSSADWAIGLILVVDFLFFGLNCLWLAYAAGQPPGDGPQAEAGGGLVRLPGGQLPYLDQLEAQRLDARQEALELRLVADGSPHHGLGRLDGRREVLEGVAEAV